MPIINCPTAILTFKGRHMREWSWAQLDKCSLSIKLDYVVGSYQALVVSSLYRLLGVLIVY